MNHLAGQSCAVLLPLFCTARIYSVRSRTNIRLIHITISIEVQDYAMADSDQTITVCPTGEERRPHAAARQSELAEIQRFKQESRLSVV